MPNPVSSSTSKQIIVNPDTHLIIEIPFAIAGSSVIALLALMIGATKLILQYRLNTENLVRSIKHLEDCINKLAEKTDEVSETLRQHSVSIEVNKQAIILLEAKQNKTSLTCSD